ncbi:MAG: D-inositol-3-phosphate glycosyltransferase [Myxococcota bacterium]|nr:D-inositol-3-phosphate glycosyltransferase [Myxococcota bacterium]
MLSSDNPRLLITAFAQIPGPSGVSQRILDLLPGLTVDFEVDIVSLKIGEVPHVQKINGARVFRVPVSGARLLDHIEMYRRAVERQITSGDYAIVHCHDPFSGAVALKQQASTRFRMAFQLHTLPTWDIKDTNPSLAAREQVIKRMRNQEKACIEQADLVICGSPAAKEFVLSRGRKAGDVLVMMEGVDPARLPAQPLPGKSPIQIGYLGSLAPWYDLATVFKAIRHVAPRIPLQLVIQGPQQEPWLSRTAELARQLGVLQHVDFKGAVRIHDVPKVLAGWDICLAPLAKTRRNLEGGVIPWKVYEYLSSGKPVIAARTPALDALLTHGHTALLYAPGDVADLARRIEELCAYPALRSDLSRAGREYAAKELCASRAWLAIRRAYRQLAPEIAPEAPPQPGEGAAPEASAGDTAVESAHPGVTGGAQENTQFVPTDSGGYLQNEADTEQRAVPTQDWLRDEAGADSWDEDTQDVDREHEELSKSAITRVDEIEQRRGVSSPGSRDRDETTAVERPKPPPLRKPRPAPAEFSGGTSGPVTAPRGGFNWSDAFEEPPKKKKGK